MSTSTHLNHVFMHSILGQVPITGQFSSTQTHTGSGHWLPSHIDCQTTTYARKTAILIPTRHFSEEVFPVGRLLALHSVLVSQGCLTLDI